MSEHPLVMPWVPGEGPGVDGVGAEDVDLEAVPFVQRVVEHGMSGMRKHQLGRCIEDGGEERGGGDGGRGKERTRGTAREGREVETERKRTKNASRQ